MQNIFKSSKNKSFKERLLAVLMALSMVLQGGAAPLLAYANEGGGTLIQSGITETSTEPEGEVGESIETENFSSQESSNDDGDGEDGGREGDHKVWICHIPEGNPENVQSIEVDESSVSYVAHLSHGDNVGNCYPVPPPPPPTICSVDIFSDTQTSFSGDVNSVPTYSGNSAWTAQILGATWIWNSYLVLNPTQDETVSFTRTFNLTSVPVAGSLVIAADNSYAVALNGNPIGADNTEYNFTDSGKDTHNVLLGLQVGINTIAFTVKNWAQAGGSPQSNPAGLLYKLHVDLSGFGCNPPPPVNQKPVITVNPFNPTTVVQFATYTETGATASDPEDGNITSSIVTTGSVNTAVVGTYTISYNVVDSNGLAADTKTRTIYVIPAPKCFDHVDNDQDGQTDYPADLGCENEDDNDENNKPIITVVGANPVAVTMGGIYVDAGATVADNEDGNITNKLVKSGSVNTNTLGAYTITYNATDTQNFAADTKTRIVNVVAACADGKDNDGDQFVDYPLDLGCDSPTDNNENTKPVITIVGANPLELTIGDVFVEPGRTAADAEEGNITPQIVTTGTVNTAVLGIYTLSYNVSDSFGLAADTKTRIVHVNKVITQCNDGINNDADQLIDFPADTGCENEDDNDENNKPVITVVGANPMQVHWNATFVDPSATASDVEDGIITTSIIATGTVNTAVLGAYTVSYNVVDSNGLAADTKTRTVNVVSSCSDGLDNDNDDLVDYPADPGCGNPTDDSENSKPVISLLGDVAMSLMLGTSYTEPSATVADQEEGNITNKLVTTGFVDMNTLGAYIVKYNATDSMALAANEVTRTVTVVAACADGKDNDGDQLVDYPLDLGCSGPADNNENDPPVITLLGTNPMNITTGGVFTDPGTTAFDPEDLDISTTTITTGTVNTAVLGSYTIHYNVTDSDGLSAVEVLRIVNVNPPVTQCNDGVDNDGDDLADYPADTGCDNSQDNDENNKPVVTVVGTNPLTIQLNASFVDLSATVADQEDGDITATKLVTTGSVNVGTLGVYTITYNATDSQSLAADTKTRTVNVVSVCSDGIDNDADGLTDYPLDPGCSEPADTSENSKPVISLLGDATMTLTVGATYLEPSATVADPEEGNITSSLLVSGAVNTGAVGTYVVSYNAMDSLGLAADPKTRAVTVNPAVCTQNCGGGSNTFDYYGCIDPSATNYNPLANKDDGSCQRGGGGGSVTLTISNEKITSTGTTTVVVTWDTNLAATGRVVYGLEPVATLGTQPLYGYGLTTVTDTTPTTTHTMTVEGIPSAASAYFRPVSIAGTQSAVGVELTRGGVLGESTECTYINEYMRLGANNNPVEVTKLQTFLRNYEGFTTLEVNGFFDTTTDAAVRAFQNKYRTDILGTWNLTGSTGYVYYTTQKKINEIYCKREFPLSTSQIAEIAAFQALVNKIKIQGSTTPILPLVGVNTKGPSISVSSTDGWVGPVNENGGTLSATVVLGSETQETAPVVARGKVRLSDLLATMPHVNDELSGTKTDSDIIKEPGVVAGASTKRGLASVVESASDKLHLSNASLYFITTLVMLTLLITAFYFTRRTKIDEIDVE